MNVSVRTNIYFLFVCVFFLFRLYHQLSQHLHTLFHSSFVTPANVIPLYEHFIIKLIKKINPLDYVKFSQIIAQQYPSK
jgi:hypothetical protein